MEIQQAEVKINQPLCREHYRLRLRVPQLPEAFPGQFMHISPAVEAPRPLGASVMLARTEWPNRPTLSHSPMLRRAFSIARLQRSSDGVEFDLIYRVVGAATSWMESLAPGHRVSVLGPLGQPFPISNDKKTAWMVAGGVGLPPMLWLAEALRAAGKEAVAFCGARSADLLALDMDESVELSRDASYAPPAAREFAASGAGIVVSTDDRSAGFHGHIGAAMEAYAEANAVEPSNLVVYTCGPERMMRFVAEYCVARGIECHVCMERAMACGTGLCQSCVVAMSDTEVSDGWSYQLCCTHGPVFDAAGIVWDASHDG